MTTHAPPLEALGHITNSEWIVIEAELVCALVNVLITPILSVTQPTVDVRHTTVNHLLVRTLCLIYRISVSTGLRSLCHCIEEISPVLSISNMPAIRTDTLSLNAEHWVLLLVLCIVACVLINLSLNWSLCNCIGNTTSIGVFLTDYPRTLLITSITDTEASLIAKHLMICIYATIIRVSLDVTHTTLLGLKCRIHLWIVPRCWEGSSYITILTRCTTCGLLLHTRTEFWSDVTTVPSHVLNHPNLH